MHKFLLCSLLLLTGCAASLSQQVKEDVSCSPMQQLQVKYAGTTTLLFQDAQTRILLDGFFSRPPLWQWITGPLLSDAQRIEASLKRLQIQHLDVIPVFHSHFDHVMDTAEVARRTGAKILGSVSTSQIARGAGLPESQIIIAEPGRTYRFGRFEVMMLPSRHMSLGPLAQFLGLDGDISKPVRQPAHLLNYREGGTYAIVIKHPEGNSLLQGTQLTTAVKNLPFDIHTLFLTTPGFRHVSVNQRQQFIQLMQHYQTQRVVAVHWDDFSRSLDEPLQPFSPLLDDFTADFNALQATVNALPHVDVELWPAWHNDCFSF